MLYYVEHSENVVSIATDLASLCSKDLEVGFAKYGCSPLKAKYSHEMAIRIILACIERNANKYSRYIVPLLSVQMDFYLRVFIRVYTSKAEIKLTRQKLGMVLQSKGCDTFFIQPLGKLKDNRSRAGRFQVDSKCPHTGAEMEIGGPIWTHPIHNQAFVKELLDRLTKPNDKFDASKLGAAKNIQGLLHAVKEEVNEVPLFYCLHSMCKLLRICIPPMVKVHAALINSGFEVSQVHCNPNGIKTTAGNNHALSLHHHRYR